MVIKFQSVVIDLDLLSNLVWEVFGYTADLKMCV